MPRQAISVVGLCLALLCACGANAEVTSIADWPCQTWTERRTSQQRMDAPQMWLAGYMTGLASAYGIDALAITDADNVFTWMDKYCDAYPDEPISSGGLIKFRDLVGKLPRGPALSL